MQKNIVLILDKRLELSTKYKKIVETLDAKVFVKDDMKKSFEVISKFEPDLIIVSDSFEQDVPACVKRLRVLSYQSRPVIVVLSKSSELDDKLNALDVGADDFLSEPIEGDEFKARVKAHLRRHIENHINEKTNLYDPKISFKFVKRILSQEEPWSVLLIDIDNFTAYKEVYGELAADKMLQTYSAIISSVFEKNDYVGHLSPNDFFVITTPYKAERVANFLVYAFEAVAEKFYSESDAKRGYITLRGDELAGERIPIVSTSIGIISNEHKRYTSMKQVLNSLISTLKLAQINEGSNYVIERPKLKAQGDGGVAQRDYNTNVLIVEPDESLLFLLKTAGEMQGYHILALSDFEAVVDKAVEFTPAVIVLDAGFQETLQGLGICEQLKKEPSLEKTKVILTSIIHDKQLVLNSKADLYLPKPYELGHIFYRVDKFVKQFNY